MRRRWINKPVYPVEIDPLSIQANGLEVFFPVIGGGTLRDYSGNERHGVKVGSPISVIDGILGAQAVDFGSYTDDWYYYADLPDLSTFTLSAWVNITVSAATSGSIQCVMSLSRPVSGANQVALNFDDSPDDYGVWDNVNSWLRSGQTREVNKKVHVMLEYDAVAAARTLYYNNVQVATESSLSTISNGKTRLYIGMEDADATLNWDGGIHDIRIYSKILTQREKDAVYYNPNGIFKPRLNLAMFSGLAITASIINLDALFKKTLTADLGFDSFLLKTIPISLSLDGLFKILNHTQLFSLDALLNKLNSQELVTLDAFLNSAGLKRSVNLDALLNKLNAQEPISLDGLLNKLGIQTSISLDAVLGVGGTFTKLQSLDSLLKKINLLATISIDSILFTEDSKQVLLDALVSKTTTKEVLIDSILKKASSNALSLDATFYKGFTSVTNLNSILYSVINRTPALDSLLAKGDITNITLMDAMLYVTLITARNRYTFNTTERDYTFNTTERDYTFNTTERDYTFKVNIN